MNHDATGNEGLILNGDVTCHQRATGDGNAVAQFAVVRDVATGHDVVVVANDGLGLRLRAA